MDEDRSMMPAELQNARQDVLERIWLTRIRIAVTSISLFVRLIASFIIAAYDGWLRRQQAVVKRFKDHLALPSIVVFSSKLSLSAISGQPTSTSRLEEDEKTDEKIINPSKPRRSQNQKQSQAPEPLTPGKQHGVRVRGPHSQVQEEAVTYPSSKIDPILQVFRVINFRPTIRWFPRKEEVEVREVTDCCHPEPEKSVSCEILYDPYPEAIRADVIFIHGLHGSIVHTWKQGLWSYRKQVQNAPLLHKEEVSLDSVKKIYQEQSDYIANDCQKKVPNAQYDELCFSDESDSAEESHIVIQNSEEHDSVLENITDIINNIDDKIKETTKGLSHEGPEQEPYSPCWPRDWLPKDCRGVRVIAVNYTTDPFLWRPFWLTKRIRTSMTQRSREMEDHLLKMGVGQHPIVWVGHSKGGLFAKQMLVDAKNSEDQKFSRFLKQTKGIMFYSVPHRGSRLAHINVPLLRQSIELTEVKKDCQEVLDLHRQFMKLYEDKYLSAEVFSFVETISTFMFVTHVRVVSVDSADLGLGSFQGVNIDHREICKPLSRDCFLYKELTNLINRVV